MAAIDTNILVRFLIQDDEQQGHQGAGQLYSGSALRPLRSVETVLETTGHLNDRLILECEPQRAASAALFFMLLPLVYNRAAQIPYELSNIECWRYLQPTQQFAFEKNSQKPLYLLNSFLS